MLVDAKRLVVDASRLNPEGEILEGEVDCVALSERFVKSVGALGYRLKAQLFGTELLVKGSLSQRFALVCSRCGRDFEDTVSVGDYTASFAIDEQQPEVDLTDELRESVLLNLSAYPVCSETCPGIERKPEKVADDRWKVLDNLK